MTLIKTGCPICKDDIVGNRDYNFFCKTCKILFDYETIAKLHQISEKPKTNFKREKLKEF